MALPFLTHFGSAVANMALEIVLLYCSLLLDLYSQGAVLASWRDAIVWVSIHGDCCKDGDCCESITLPGCWYLNKLPILVESIPYTDYKLYSDLGYCVCTKLVDFIVYILL